MPFRHSAGDNKRNRIFIGRRFVHNGVAYFVDASNPTIRLAILAFICLIITVLVEYDTMLPKFQKPELAPDVGSMTALVLKIVDGDTINIELDDVPSIFKRIGCRLYGIDTPEISRSNCCVEKCLGMLAKKKLETLSLIHRRVLLKNVKKGKYFRIVADVYLDGLKMSQLLLDDHLATNYYGKGKRLDWCSEKLDKKHRSKTRCRQCFKKT